MQSLPNFILLGAGLPKFNSFDGESTESICKMHGVKILSCLSFGSRFSFCHYWLSDPSNLSLIGLLSNFENDALSIFGVSINYFWASFSSFSFLFLFFFVNPTPFSISFSKHVSAFLCVSSLSGTTSTSLWAGGSSVILKMKVSFPASTER